MAIRERIRMETNYSFGNQPTAAATARFFSDERRPTECDGATRKDSAQSGLATTETTNASFHIRTALPIINDDDDDDDKQNKIKVGSTTQTSRPRKTDTNHSSSLSNRISTSRFHRINSTASTTSRISNCWTFIKTLDVDG